jgi:dTDP-4-amino-4,6-dideoxygalactose transaminase
MGANRDAFMESMKLQGIQTSIHYPPIHSFEAYRDFHHNPLPVTEDVARREVTLPLFPALTEDQVIMVAHAAREALMGKD